jgi:hypothetical protein
VTCSETVIGRRLGAIEVIEELHGNFEEGVNIWLWSSASWASLAVSYRPSTLTQVYNRVFNG